MENLKDSSAMCEEQKHLIDIQKTIEDKLDEIGISIDKSLNDIKKQKQYLWENIYEFDPEEIASNRTSILEEQDSYIFKDKEKRFLTKLYENPYFGRVDFRYVGEEKSEFIYIGLGGLRDKKGIVPLVYDWRAPISSLYYNFELGRAFYTAPIGKIEGEISKKRQIKIRNGILEYAIDSDIKIDDEMLQKELFSNSSIKMKNIVATIQKEQNVIIRDQNSYVLLIQGVAGSGKTSVALHRIAYLLYNDRRTLSSQEILILSPNKIFADYISNVLPELGEENISEVSFDEIARMELKGVCKFESKYKQMDYVLNCNSENDKRIENIQYKNSINFLYEIKQFAKDLEKTLIHFSSFDFNGFQVCKEELERMFNEVFLRGSLFERLDNIGERIADNYESDFNKTVSQLFRKEIKKQLYKMATTTDVVELYREFLHRLEDKHQIFVEETFSGAVLPYEDIYGILLLKFILFGKMESRLNRIKHVVIDEMQDYSMTQFELLNILFDCKMTILGDINQVIGRDTNDMLDNIKHVLKREVNVNIMRKSYRSTYEISEFCSKLCNLTEIEAFERHGSVPDIIACNCYLDMIKQVQQIISYDKGLSTVAIICKTSQSAELLYYSLETEFQKRCHLLSEADEDFSDKVIVTHAYLAKGLEFEHVIIPEVTAEMYYSENDRQALYIAATRAINILDILYYGEKSTLIN